MIIKKHKNKNKYINVDGIYIRDFTAYGIIPVDINKSLNLLDQDVILDNELENYVQKYSNIDNEEIFHDKIVIVSDGYQFQEKHKLLADLARDITIIAVNGALKKWSLVGEKAEVKRVIDYYVVNNPYPECKQFLPDKHRYYPKCISSIRTNPEFLRLYHGNKYIYSPTKNELYSGVGLKSSYEIDDYRNPICAALNLAYHFRSNKILLFCCDDSFECEKPTAIKLENNLWHYQQQELSQKIIDAYCYWLKLQKTEVADYSSGRKYENVPYIENKDSILEFFNE